MPANYFNAMTMASLVSVTALTLPVITHADNHNNVAYEAVIGIDSRYAVNPYTYPNNAVTRITYNGENNTACSGWLSSPNTLVTAGHCIWAKETRQNLSIYKVYPGYDGNRVTPIGGSCTAQKTYLYAEWRDNDNPAYDVGVIKLDCSRKDLQALPYAYLPASIDFRGTTLTISGYPGDKPGAASQWASQGKLLDYTPTLLAYDNDTYGGMSGSPIWLEAGDGKPPLVIGIHTTGFSDANGTAIVNAGVHLTDQIIADIRSIEKLP